MQPEWLLPEQTPDTADNVYFIQIDVFMAITELSMHLVEIITIVWYCIMHTRKCTNQKWNGHFAFEFANATQCTRHLIDFIIILFMHFEWPTHDAAAIVIWSFRSINCIHKSRQIWKIYRIIPITGATRRDEKMQNLRSVTCFFGRNWNRFGLWDRPKIAVNISRIRRPSVDHLSRFALLSINLLFVSRPEQFIVSTMDRAHVRCWSVRAARANTT